MKILCFSDSHGNYKNIINAIEMNRHGLDYVICLGDGCDDGYMAMSQFPEIPYMAVKGNYEEVFTSKLSDASLPDECILELAGKRFLICHGHKYGVKSTLENIAIKGRAAEADIVLFGHTHIPCDIQEDKIRFVNPGSIGKGVRRTYALIRVVNDVIICGHGEV